MALLFWLALLAVYLALKWTFRHGLMPAWLAYPWCKLHFMVWDVLVHAANRYFGYRSEPWKEVRPGLWLGMYVLASHVPTLKALGITRVLNLQAENIGPVAAFSEAGIEQLYIPVIDHCEPTPEQIEEGVRFIERAAADGQGVYVHCQGEQVCLGHRRLSLTRRTRIRTHTIAAGHGRSAAIVFAFLCHTEVHHSPAQHNVQLHASWRVRPGLHKQPSINRFLDKRRKAKN